MLCLLAGCSDRKEDNPLTSNNQPPVLQVIGFAADTLVYVAGRSYPFEFRATDDNQQTLKVTAKAVGETGVVTIVDQTADGLYKASFTPAGKGTHLIEISVSDGLATTSETLSVFMGDNRPPVAVIVFQETARDVENLLFTYEFDASQSSDRDGSLVKATWDLDGVVVEAQVDEKVVHTFNYYADYKIQLTVEDEFGGTDTASEVVDNSRPLASFVIRPLPESPNGQQVTFDASNSISPRAPIAEYRWFYRRGSQGIDVLGVVTDNLFRYTVNLPVGAIPIGLVVEDEEGNLSDSSWVALTVLNTAPTADFNFRTELERLIITENLSTDIDPGDSLSYSWFINDSLQAPQEGEPLPEFEVRGDVYQVTLRTTDNHGGANSRTRTVSVPGVPEADFVFADSNSDTLDARNGQTIRMDGSSSIAGNESSGLESFTWLLRGESFPQQTLSDGGLDDITLELNHPIGEYEVGLRVTNREGLRSATTWKSLSILNSDPTAEFTCEFEAFPQALVYRILTNDSTDPDPGDSLRFRWFLDGEQQPQTGPTPSFTRDLSSFVEIITLRVLDNHGGAGEKSISGGCSDTAGVFRKRRLNH